MPEPTSTKPRLGFLQVLRAAAALLVLLFHCGREWGWRDPAARHGPLALLGIFDFGVDLFFVISGFVMVYVTADKPGGVGAGGRFLLRRLIRVGPLYWLATILFILPVLIAPETLHRRGYSPAYIVASFLFVPWQRPDDVIPSVSPIYGLGWTLNYEMIFYLLFAGMIAASVRRPVLPLAAGFVLLGAVGFFVPPTMAQAYFYTRTLLIEFALGGAICLAFRAGLRFPPLASGAALVVGVLIWLVGGALAPVHDGTVNIRGLLWGAGAALAVAGVALTPALAATFDSPAMRPLRRLGDASFSLYLSHLFVVRLLSILFVHLGLVKMPGLFVLAALVASCLVAWLLHCVIERPILRFERRLAGRTASE